MLVGKALIEDTDMPLKMQIQAMDTASQALDLYDVGDCIDIAGHIKMVINWEKASLTDEDVNHLCCNCPLCFSFLLTSLL